MTSKKDLCVRFRAREENICSCPVGTERMRVFNRKRETLPAIPACISSYKNLKELFIEDAGITDIKNLSSLASMERLVIDHNDIDDISPLLSLPQLKYVNIVGNPKLQGNRSANGIVNNLRRSGVEVAYFP